jgi:hypothetical protein
MSTEEILVFFAVSGRCAAAAAAGAILSAAVGAIHLLFRSYFLASSGESALLKIQNTADMATFAHTKRNQHPENDHQLKKKYIGIFFVGKKKPVQGWFIP